MAKTCQTFQIFYEKVRDLYIWDYNVSANLRRIFYLFESVCEDIGRDVESPSQRLILQIQPQNHSLRKLFTGFINAARTAW